MAIELPEDFEEADKITSRFKDTADLAKAYRELEKKLGNVLPRPTDESSMDALLEKLGAPATPDGYQLPSGVDANSIGQLQEWAAKAKLTPEQFARVAEQMHGAAADHFEQQRRGLEKEQTAVQKAYGEAFPEAQARVVKALEAMPEEERAVYNPEDPAHFRLLEKLGRGATEGQPKGLAPTAGQGDRPSFDPKVVAKEARQILESPAYTDRFHPEHQAAKDEYAERAYKLVEAGFEGAYDGRLMPPTGPWSRR